MNNKIIYQGKKNYKNNKEYKRKKFLITQNVENKFNPLIRREKNILRKVKLIIEKKVFLKKELEIIESEEILFSNSNS